MTGKLNYLCHILILLNANDIIGVLKQLLHLNSVVCWWHYTYAEVTALYLHTHLLTTEQVFWSCFLTSSLKMVGVILLEGASMRRRARFCPSASTIPRCQAPVTLSLEKTLQGALRVLFKCMACTKIIVHVIPWPFFDKKMANSQWYGKTEMLYK